MKWIISGALCALLAIGVPCGAASLDAEAIAARNMPAVLIVHGKRVDSGAPVQGSGCCVHPDGYILATAHQAEGVQDFTGRFADGTTVPLVLVESRPDIEFALFKAASPLPAHVALGDAAMVKSGAPIVSIASPINLEFSTVSGTVSNPNKEYDGYPVMLVSLTATHGSSGGPVFDRDGRLIGLISGGLSDVDFTIVNKVNNAFPLLAAAGIQPPNGAAGVLEESILVPAPGISEAELRAVEAYNRGVAVGAAAEKIDAYGLAVALLPAFYEAHFNLALAQASAGDLEQAARSYLRADQLRPDNIAAKRNLGRLYLLAKQYDDAIGVFEAARQLAPDEAQSHNDLGEANRRAGNLEVAAHHFTQSLEINSDAPGAHYNLALTLAAMGETARAIGHLEAYLALAPQAGDAADVRAWIEKLKSAP